MSMRTHQEKSLVPFTPAQMFDLVADVTTYPHFIPWIEALRVREDNIVAGHGLLTADMIVKYKLFRETFRSEVTFDRTAKSIDVAYVRGPLKSLTNHWQFVEAREGCLIDFRISFEFRNILMQTLANQLIDKVFMRLSGAFIDEAHRRYTPIHIEKRQETS